MPKEYITNSIVSKTLTQSHMIHMVLEKFIGRSYKSCIITISAQCVHESNFISKIGSNYFTLPYLSVYEGSNAFSFFQANSIYKEFKLDSKYSNIDYLNITPGSVHTPNTKKMLKNIPFSIDYKEFVKNCIRLMGNYNGVSCGCLSHELNFLLLSLFPFAKSIACDKVGNNIAKYYMKHHKDKLY
jgi:hypothetical protein